jgi:hypothetical protein
MWVFDNADFILLYPFRHQGLRAVRPTFTSFDEFQLNRLVFSFQKSAEFLVATLESCACVSDAGMGERV